jgi:hypothetical protein
MGSTKISLTQTTPFTSTPKRSRSVSGQGQEPSNSWTKKFKALTNKKHSYYEITVVDKLRPSILSLVKTHLSKDITLSSRVSFQTEPHRRGVVYVACGNSSSRHTFQRSFKNYAIWSIILIHGIRVYLISVYNPCDTLSVAEQESILKWVSYIIKQMILAANSDKNILNGDFNQKLFKFKRLASQVVSSPSLIMRRRREVTVY